MIAKEKINVAESNIQERIMITQRTSGDDTSFVSEDVIDIECTYFRSSKGLP